MTAASDNLTNLSRRKAPPAARRGEFLDQALAMFGERGFNGLTIQSLAERCGISNAGLLYYFGSKDELLLAVLDELDLREREAMEPLVAAAERGTGGAATTLESVRNLLATMLARQIQTPTTTRFLLVLRAEATDREHIAHDWFRERDRLAHELFDALLKGLVPDSAETARNLTALMQGLGLQWLREDQAFDLMATWNRACALLLPADDRRPDKNSQGT